MADEEGRKETVDVRKLGKGEAATVFGVAAAVAGGLFWATGTAWYIAYYQALGYDAHLFPGFGLEVPLLGALSGIVAAAYIALWVGAYVCFVRLVSWASERWGGKLDDWGRRHPNLATTIPLAASLLLALALYAFLENKIPWTSPLLWIGAFFLILGFFRFPRYTMLAVFPS